jgi:antitoxin component YwqK of YwqJK toxin-antitoxin module
MKKILLFGFAFLLLGTVVALAQKEPSGKTYYDTEKTKPKEVFMYKQVVKMDPDNLEAGGSTTYQKHGPYFYYYENGKLKTSGQYSNDQMHGEWKYYDDKGKLIKTETYNNGKLVQ